jgi:hypothetical protein|tara:strand:- start:2959 stop:3369 length:411 start_codon:yes stop_codon:yes gene_type:complete
MAHIAKLNKEANADGTHTVLNVYVVSDNVTESELSARSGEMYRKTSYNTRAGTYFTPNTNTIDPDQSKAFRGNFAAKGMVFDPVKDKFYWPAPHPDWTLNETEWQFYAPTPHPETLDENGFPDKYIYTDSGWEKVT